MDEAIKRLELNSEITMICNAKKIGEYGINQPPALIINGEVAVEGWVPSIFKMPEIIKKYASNS